MKRLIDKYFRRPRELRIRAAYSLYCRKMMNKTAIEVTREMRSLRWYSPRQG